MSSNVMRVRLHLRQVRVLEVVADAPGRFKVAVEPVWSWSRCPHCGFKCRRVHDRRVKRAWDRPVSGRETVLLWRRQRWRCENCAARHLDEHPEFEGKVTRRLARRRAAAGRVGTLCRCYANASGPAKPSNNLACRRTSTTYSMRCAGRR